MLIEGHTSIYCMSGKQFKSVDNVTLFAEARFSKFSVDFLIKC